MAAVPAAVTLVVIRGRLGAAGARFWSPFGLGLFALTLVAIGAIAWASAISEAEIVACSAEPAGTRVGCEDAGLLVVMVGSAAILSLLIYTLVGVGAHWVLRRRAVRAEASS